MFRSTAMRTLIAAAALGAASQAPAALITFDDLVFGATSYAYDGDGDGVADAVFSTSDPAGFRTAGPGPNQTYIREPGLEGTSLLNPDLRVDFTYGALTGLGFGFALDSLSESAAYYASFEVYDASDTLIASSLVSGVYTATPGGTSSFPEGQINVAFAGKAAYALFNFTSEYGRYIIDDFKGTYGNTEVPEPWSLALVMTGLAAATAAGRRRARSGG